MSRKVITRRNQQQSQHDYQNYQQTHRKPAQHHHQQQQPQRPKPADVQVELISIVEELMEVIQSYQQHASECLMRAVVAEERKAASYEDIALLLSHLLEEQKAQSAYAEPVHHQTYYAPEPPQPVKKRGPGRPRKSRSQRTSFSTAKKGKKIKRDEGKLAELLANLPKDTSEGYFSKEQIMAIIHEMREYGATYDDVAQYFISIGHPTLSGRGKWHAQTVHRLCHPMNQG